MRPFVPILLLALAPSVALAHGGRPQTYDALFGASDDDIVVPGTFGVMATRDGGATWDWLCIEGMPDAVRGTMRPATRTPSDAILFAQNFGLVIGRQRACDPIFDTTLHDRFVADVTAIPGGGFAAISSDADMPNHLFRSTTGTDAFAAIGDALPPGFLPERARYAPSDRMRLYVSGEAHVVGSSSYVGSLLVSRDGGMHWTAIDVPLMGDESVVRVLAVDPSDPDRFFMVAQSSSTDRLIEGTAGGATLASTLVMPAVAIAVNRPFGLGFASDGTIWFGNTRAGLYRIVPGMSSESVDKHLHVACVVPHGDAVYLCADGLLDVFAFGVQRGPDYAPVALMRFAQLTTQRTCGTSLDAVCEGWWNDLLIDTGRLELIPPDAGVPDAGPIDASDTVFLDAGAASPPARCACRAGGSAGGPSLGGLALSLIVVSRAARRAKRRC